MAANFQNQASGAAAGQERIFGRMAIRRPTWVLRNTAPKSSKSANTNINAAVEQATKMSRARSPMEFTALSNEYARQQFEILSLQARELAEIAQK